MPAFIYYFCVVQVQELFSQLHKVAVYIYIYICMYVYICVSLYLCEYNNWFLIINYQNCSIIITFVNNNHSANVYPGEKWKRV